MKRTLTQMVQFRIGHLGYCCPNATIVVPGGRPLNDPLMMALWARKVEADAIGGAR